MRSKADGPPSSRICSFCSSGRCGCWRQPTADSASRIKSPLRRARSCLAHERVGYPTRARITPYPSIPPAGSALMVPLSAPLLRTFRSHAAGRLVLTGLVLAVLGGCGGGGGSGPPPPPSPPPPPPSYNISGTVSDPFTDGALGQVGLTLVLSDGGAGTPVANVTTDSAGHYVFPKVPPGSYTISPSLANTRFTPALLGVTVVAADVTGEDFQGIQSAQVATGLSFLPSTF